MKGAYMCLHTPPFKLVTFSGTANTETTELFKTSFPIFQTSKYFIIIIYFIYIFSSSKELHYVTVFSEQNE